MALAEYKYEVDIAAIDNESGHVLAFKRMPEQNSAYGASHDNSAKKQATRSVMNLIQRVEHSDIISRPQPTDGIIKEKGWKLPWLNKDRSAWSPQAVTDWTDGTVYEERNIGFKIITVEHLNTTYQYQIILKKRKLIHKSP